MSNIIALGTPACAVAEKFKEYKVYSVYKIDDSGKPSPADFVFPRRQTAEEYESSGIRLPPALKKIKGDLLFIVSGSSLISALSLVLLEQLSKNCKIKILYLEPNIDFLSADRVKQERIVRGVLQEYARSGLFEELSLVSNTTMEDLVGPSTVYELHDKINYMIAYNYHMINVLKNTESVISTFSNKSEAARLVSYGVMDQKTGEPFLFFPLDIIRETRYYYSIPEELLRTEKNLVRDKVSSLKQREQFGQGTYAFFETAQDDEYVIMVSRSSKIQI